MDLTTLVTLFSCLFVLSSTASSETETNYVTVTSPLSSIADSSEASKCHHLTVFNVTVCSPKSDECRTDDVSNTTVTSSPPATRDVAKDRCDEGKSPASSGTLSWNFVQRPSYLRLTFAHKSRISNGYFRIKMGKCQKLRWRFNITSENKDSVTVKDIVSETKTVASSSSSSSSNDVTQHFFRFDEFDETSEIFVESLEKTNGETGAVTDPGDQGKDLDCHLRYLCTNSRVIEVILLQNVCDDSGKTPLVPTPSARTASVPPVPTPTVAAATESQSPTPSATMALPVTVRTTPSPPAALQSTVETTVAETTRPFRASFRIRNRHYQADLGEVNSTAYNSFYFTIFPVLNVSYSMSFGLLFRGVKRVSFGTGSVIVISWFDMSGNLTEEMKTNSTNSLISGLRNINLDVDPNSFIFEPDTEAESKDTATDKNQAILIAIISSVFVVLVVILVVIVVHLMKVKFSGRRSSRCEPEIVSDPDHQMAAHDAASPPQLMWQTIPSLKDSFDGSGLEYGYTHEPPLCCSETAPSCVAPGGKTFPLRTSMTVSSCSSLSSSCSKKDCRENQEVFFSRVASSSFPSSYHDPVPDSAAAVAAKAPPITLRPETKRCSTVSSYFPPPPSRGFLPEEEGGQHPTRFELSSISLDYSQITQDYFAGDGGGGTRAKNYFDAGRCGKAATVSIKTPKRLRSWSSKKNPSRRRSVVDFGNVFLPSASPFQLAPIESGGSAASAEVRVDPCPSSTASKRGCSTVTVEPQESDDTAAASAAAAAACPSSGSGEPPELGEIEDVEETPCGDETVAATAERKVTGISRAPSFTNSLTQLFTPIFAKSPKKPKPIQDNIHRSFTLPNDILFENTNLGTSNM